MVPINLAKVTLFLVVLLVALATSQPFSRSQSTTSRRSGFEWNTRRIGAKKVATISIRKDEERDRRSIALGGDNDKDDREPGATYGIPLAGSSHHHGGHATHRRKEERSTHHYHRHHHGEPVPRGRDTQPFEVAGEEEEEDDEEDEEDEESDEEDGMGWRLESRERMIKEDREREVERLVAERLDVGDLITVEDRIVEATILREILSSAELEIDAELFKNVTGKSDRRKRKNPDRKSGRNKKRSKKVKRDRKRKRRGKKGKGKGKRKNKNRGKCKQFTGKEKKKCRAEARARKETPPSGISISGDEACQYHNLEECSRKVGLLTRGSATTATSDRCRFREEFFDCMEEQRMEMCDPNFQTLGNVSALRRSIRDAIQTPSSCIISEVLEG